MDDKFPISNIPLIFTQYRNRILAESGQKWFHSDNQPDYQHESIPETFVPGVERLQGETDTDLDSVSTIGSDHRRESTGSQSNPTSHIYDYPDPWDLPATPPPLAEVIHAVSAPSSSIQSSPASPPSISSPTTTHPQQDVNASGTSPRAESVSFETSEPFAPDSLSDSLPDSPQQQPSTPATAPDPTFAPTSELTPGPTHTAVNLFPFEPSSTSDRDIPNTYDLTEFDNGEIEVPPVAIRESQTAQYEKVYRPSSSSQNQDDIDDDLDDQSLLDPISLNKRDLKNLSSAEIAKHRLRNCL